MKTGRCAVSSIKKEGGKKKKEGGRMKWREKVGKGRKVERVHFTHAIFSKQNYKTE